MIFRRKIACALATKTAREWEDLLNAQHIPAARARRIDETLKEPQIASRQLLQSYGRPLGPGAPQELPTAAFSFAHGGPKHSRPPPGFGSDSDSILSELGYSSGEILALRTAKVLQEIQVKVQKDWVFCEVVIFEPEGWLPPSPQLQQLPSILNEVSFSPPLQPLSYHTLGLNAVDRLATLNRPLIGCLQYIHRLSRRRRGPVRGRFNANAPQV